MSTLDNIERLIQMATIEQLYSMLRKMNNNIDKPPSIENVHVPVNNDIFNDRLKQLEDKFGDYEKKTTDFNNSMK